MVSDSSLSVEEILDVAIDGGQMILENGGETYRVEEVIGIVCEACGAIEHGVFVTVTGIMASASDGVGHSVSIVRRVSNRTTNFEKITAAVALSRRIREDKPSVAWIRTELENVRRCHKHSFCTLVIAAGFVTGFFSVLFGGTLSDMLASFLIGILLKITLSGLEKASLSGFFCNVVGGGFATSCAFLVAKFSPTFHMDKITIGGVMLLVPGLAITNAVRDTISGDYVAGLARASEAFLVALAIAFGSGFSLKLMLVLTGGVLP